MSFVPSQSNLGDNLSPPPSGGPSGAKGDDGRPAVPPYSKPGTPMLHHAHKIGFIGLGSMGWFMARNLGLSPANDQPLVVYNRTASKSESLAKELGQDRVKIAKSVAEIVESADVIFTNLANDDVVQKIYAEIASALKASAPTENKIFVETSTIYPTVAGQLDSTISAFPKAHFVSAPVFGAPPAADKAQLIIVMAGEYKIKKEVAHIVIPAMGRKIVDMGENVEKAPSLKLIGNGFILGIIELLSETMTMADKTGVGASNLYEVLKEILPGAPVVGYGAKILNDSFDGTKGFSLAGGIKDATHIRALAASANSPIPTIDLGHGNLLTARALQTAASVEGVSKPPYEVLDWSSLVAGARLAAGLPGFDSTKHGAPQPEPR